MSGVVVRLLAAFAALLFACGGAGTPEPAQISPTPVATEESAPSQAPIKPGFTPVVTTGPATYVDPTYGYSYEIPSGWFVLQSEGGYSALTKRDPRTEPQDGSACGHESGVFKVEFFVDEIGEEENLESWLRLRDPPNPTIIEQSDWSIDGVPGIRRIRSLDGDSIADSDQYFVKIGNRVYAIMAYCFDPSLGILAELLPTVHFR